jgi:hypothetical protein
LIERGIVPKPYRLGDPERGRLAWLEADIEDYVVPFPFMLHKMMADVPSEAITAPVAQRGAGCDSNFIANDK